MGVWVARARYRQIVVTLDSFARFTCTPRASCKLDGRRVLVHLMKTVALAILSSAMGTTVASNRFGTYPPRSEYINSIA